MSDPNKPRPSASSTVSQTVTEEPKEAEAQPVLKLRLKKPPSSRRVQWAEDTVDNEHMDKKKSKCCCIYKKPLDFGESDSESSDDDDDDDDCQHCSHHKKNDYVAARDGQTQDKTEGADVTNGVINGGVTVT